MDTLTTSIRLRRAVAVRVAEMPRHEERFWEVVDGLPVDRGRAGRLLDVAVDWIGAGRGAVCDPYALALSWMPR